MSSNGSHTTEALSEFDRAFMPVRIGVDRGGTFTDVVAWYHPDSDDLHDAHARDYIRTHKLLSEDPGHYGDAVLEGIRRTLQLPADRVPAVDDIDALRDALAASPLQAVCIGTTVATNALLERKGARTGLLVTAGFGDLPRIGDQARPDIFALEIVKPAPLHERMFEVDERLDARGRVLLEPDWAIVDEALRAWRADGIESVAIAFLHADLNDEHERRAAELAERHGFAYVTRSSIASPLPRLVPRLETTIVDAYLTPVLRRYVDALRRALPDRVWVGFMQSAGGLATPTAFTGKDAIVSGPAGGVIGLATIAAQAGVERAIGWDMGGTSTDVSVVESSDPDTDEEDRNRAPRVIAGVNPARDATTSPATDATTSPARDATPSPAADATPSPAGGEPSRERPHPGDDSPGSVSHSFLPLPRSSALTPDRVDEVTLAGTRLRTPMLRILTVAAGGGSILSYAQGRLQVGPDSAGANPGPRCYGRGGPFTITDANLVLHRLVPAFFPRVFGPNHDGPLDVRPTIAAFAEWTAEIARDSGVDRTPEELAEGFVDIAVEAMIKPIKALSIERGRDVREYTLVCFGGAGGQHACAVARKLGIKRIIVHPLAGVLSAYGIGVADTRAVRSVPLNVAWEAWASAPESIVAPMLDAERDAATSLETDARIPRDRLGATHTLHVRYRGAGAPLRVTWPRSTGVSPVPPVMPNAQASTHSTAASSGADERAGRPLPQGWGDALRTAFEAEHQRRFGYTLPADVPIVIESAEIDVAGASDVPARPPREPIGDPFDPPAEPSMGFVAAMDTFAQGRWHHTMVYDRADLPPNMPLVGPVIVIDRHATIVIEPGFQGSAQPDGSIVIEMARPAVTDLPPGMPIIPGLTVPADAMIPTYIGKGGVPIVDIAPRSTGVSPVSPPARGAQTSANPKSGKAPALDSRGHGQDARATAADPILLEVFNHRFMSIAEQMGVALRNTAHSVNIRERLDFSCALFDADAGLVANAPHMPVHLGAMGETVRAVAAACADDVRPGDVYVSNDPAAGGSHLPDITVVAPVFASELSGNVQALGNRAQSASDGAGAISHTHTGPAGAPTSRERAHPVASAPGSVSVVAERPVFWLGARGHHADVGGITPGSMPPDSTSIAEEGVVLRNERLCRDGAFDEAALRAKLGAGPHPARNADENVADLRAQVAAMQTGRAELKRLVDEFGLATVAAYMGHIQSNAADAVREVLSRLPAQCRFADKMDDGTPIVVEIRVTHDDRAANDRPTATVDFTGTGPAVAGNRNAPRAVAVAAVLYAFRLLVAKPIPLNAGCLHPLTLIIPEGTILHPPEGVAVVGGNVETSQRVTDVLLAALGASAAAQGTMNNLTFGSGMAFQAMSPARSTEQPTATEFGPQPARSSSAGQGGHGLEGHATFTHYETICGGAGAGPTFDGATAVHTHMTNTRITDPETLERRFPVRLIRFAIRPGSGGAGRHRGGDGSVREYEFLAPATVSLLAERRIQPPFGLDGGAPGDLGRERLQHADGIIEQLQGAWTRAVEPGARLTIETPGGGGFGQA